MDHSFKALHNFMLLCIYRNDLKNCFFDSVGLAAHFGSSLAPGPTAMVARSRPKMCDASLSKFQFLSSFGMRDYTKETIYG